MRLFFITFLLLFSLREASVAYAASDTLFTYYYSKAKKQISLSEYEEALFTWKKIFELKVTYPDELAYYYGLTQFMLKKFGASNQAFEKYLELTGHEGEFSREAREMLKEGNCQLTGFFEDNYVCDFCDGSGKETVSCNTCKGKGKTYCMACNGSGVTREKKALGDTYHSCAKCEGSGILECVKCNGIREQRISCLSCQGKGLLKLRKKCR